MLRGGVDRGARAFDAQNEAAGFFQRRSNAVGGLIALRMLPWNDWALDQISVALIALPFGVPMVIAPFAFLLSMVTIIRLTNRRRRVRDLSP